MSILPATQRCLAAAVLAAAALFAAGCSQTVAGSPQLQGNAQPLDAPPPSALAPAPEPAPQAQRGADGKDGTSVTSDSGTVRGADGADGGCQFNLAVAGTTKVNIAQSCNGGPPIVIVSVADQGVTVSVGGSVSVVAPGTSTKVGPYTIAVTKKGNGSVTVDATPA